MVWAAVAAAILAAGITQGALGFGFPAISTPILVLLTDVKTAIILNLLPNFTVNVISVMRGGNWGASLGASVAGWVVGLALSARLRILGALTAGAAGLLPMAGHAAQPEIEEAKRLWAQSPHGAMLERILPPSVEPRELPEPSSESARLAVKYCVQCHYLPNPRMHSAERWKPVVERMVWRMRGNGNMGEVMKEMMAQVTAPSDAEVAKLTAYLQKHGQREIDPKHPVLATRPGEMFSLACSQCHALPDPRRHTAREWPAVVERMKRHMAWTNIVVGPPELRTQPELKTEEIVRLLQQHARPEPMKR